MDRPKAVFGPTGPDGEQIDTPVEHRLLWWIRDNLVGCPNYLQPTYKVLNDYLAVNCQHHWRDYPDCYPPHRRCLWCNSVEDLTQGDYPEGKKCTN